MKVSLCYSGHSRFDVLISLAAASTLRAGLGQSMAIGVGGDVLPGTTILDGLRTLIDDEDTEAVALIGEIGGDAEIEAANWVTKYRAQSSNPK